MSSKEDKNSSEFKLNDLKQLDQKLLDLTDDLNDPMCYKHEDTFPLFSQSNTPIGESLRKSKATGGFLRSETCAPRRNNNKRVGIESLNGESDDVHSDDKT